MNTKITIIFIISLLSAVILGAYLGVGIAEMMIERNVGIF